jgi:hypothetical protein
LAPELIWAQYLDLGNARADRRMCQNHVGRERGKGGIRTGSSTTASILFKYLQNEKLLITRACTCPFTSSLKNSKKYLHVGNVNTYMCMKFKT